MGIKLFSSSSFDNNDWDKSYSVNFSNSFPFIKVEEQVVVQTAPDPSKFTIDAVKQVGDHLVLRVIYHEATNYEGKKVLVFKDCTHMELVKRNKGVIDPHFSKNNNYISPFARFEPTNEGWLTAIRLCKTL